MNVADRALAMGKPYLAYRLYEKANEGFGAFAESFSLLPGPLGSEKGLLVLTHRFNRGRAACAAAAGAGRDRVKAPEADRAKLREEALRLFDEERKAQVKDADSLEKQSMVLRWLCYCKTCPDLASVRGEELAKLAGSPKEEWIRFWGEVDAMLAKIRKETARD